MQTYIKQGEKLLYINLIILVTRGTSLHKNIKCVIITNNQLTVLF